MRLAAAVLALWLVAGAVVAAAWIGWRRQVNEALREINRRHSAVRPPPDCDCGCRWR